MEENKLFLTKLLKCTKNQFETLLAQANALLGYSNDLAKNYCDPIIDKYGNYYFVVNEEVLSLVDYSLCIFFEEIEFNTTL